MSIAKYDNTLLGASPKRMTNGLPPLLPPLPPDEEVGTGVNVVALSQIIKYFGHETVPENPVIVPVT